MKHPPSDGNDSWITLATFDAQAETQPLVAVLEMAGVKTFVQDERKVQRFWFLARQQAGIHVRVPEASLPAVRDLLQSDLAVRAAFQRAIRCPSCNSSRVQYPQMTRKNLLPTLAAHVLVALRVMEHECYCEDCHYSWVREDPTAVTAKAKRNGG